MRRVLVPVVVAVGLAGAATGPAAAQVHASTPTASSVYAQAVPAKKVCTADDGRLIELSGLLATSSGYIVVNDSSDIDRNRRVFFLNKKCDVEKAVAFASQPRDPEDLAFSADRKTVWIADTGDLGRERDSVVLWRMPADGSAKPVLFRLSYPDGAKDAEALLIGSDGQPVIITKGAQTLVYKPTEALTKGGTTALKKAGEVKLPKTSTSNPLGAIGRGAVTGAAASPDNQRVVLRTYADAFEWDVPNGDIAAALTTGQPRVTPLPDEPRGESIAYTTDGSSFLTVSETADQPENVQPVIQRYTPAKAVAKPTPAAGGSAEKKDTRSFFEKLDLGDITAFIAVIGVIGLLLVAAGVIGIVIARRRAAEAANGDGAGPDGGDQPVRAAARVPTGETPGGAGDGVGPVPDAAVSGPVYGGARVGSAAYASDGENSGAVYGSDREHSGAVYGAGRGGGGAGYGSDREDSGAVYGAGRGGGGAGYGSDREHSGAVYGSDRENSGAVYGAGAGAGAAGGYPAAPPADQYGRPEQGGPVRGAPVRGAPVRGGQVPVGPVPVGPAQGGPVRGGQVPVGPVQGGPVQGGPVQGGPVQGGPVQGGPQRGGQHPGGAYGGGPEQRGYGGGPGQRGTRPRDPRAQGYPDAEAGGYAGNGYPEGTYPQDGYVDQPTAGRRPPLDRRDQGYGDADYDYDYGDQGYPGR